MKNEQKFICIEKQTFILIYKKFLRQICVKNHKRALKKYNSSAVPVCGVIISSENV